MSVLFLGVFLTATVAASFDTTAPGYRKGLRENPRSESGGGDEYGSKFLTPKVEAVKAEPIKPVEKPASPAANTTPIDAKPAENKSALQDVLFDFDSWTITEAGHQILVKVAEQLKANQTVTLEGYCDERGTAAYNVILGEKRAKAVKNYLVDLGVKSTLTVVSYGEEMPVCDETTEACYQQNRRVHFVIE